MKLLVRRDWVNGKWKVESGKWKIVLNLPLRADTSPLPSPSGEGAVVSELCERYECG